MEYVMIECPNEKCKNGEVVVHSRPDSDSTPDDRTFYKCEHCGTLFYER